MPSFVDRMLAKYASNDKVEDVIKEFYDFYKKNEMEAKSKGIKRTISYLGNVQSNLSKYKARVPAPEEFKKKLHLTKPEAITLMKERAASMKSHSIDIIAVNGDAYVKDCQKMLTHPDFTMKVIALACLTGRRMAEIISSVKFDDPQEKHFTNSMYWACASGLLKQRGDNKCIDIPLFAPRKDINICLQAVRDQSGHIAKEDVNKLVAKKIARSMKRYCPEIGNIHAFRKFYALMAFYYFNDRHCSLPRLTSDYLGHKAMSETVLTYLNFRLQNTGSLNFT